MRALHSMRVVGWLTSLIGACEASEPGQARDAGSVEANDAASKSAPANGRRLATSSTHSCVIRAEQLYCWGRNARGELGDGTQQDSDVAVRAQVAGVGVIDVALYSGRTCIRRNTGELACWGANERGQIGDGTRDDALDAVAPQGISDAAQLAVDGNSTCAVHGPERRVSCWGAAPADAPDAGSLVPQRIAGLEGIEQLQVGSFGSYCALDSGHTVKCWRTPDGQSWTEPHSVDGVSGARAIALPHPDYVCAIVEAAGVVCQGIDTDTSVELPDSEAAVALVSGGGGLVACAPNADLAWQCWNVPSFLFEAMGESDVAGRFPISVRSDMPVQELAIAGFRVCVLREDQTVACSYEPDASQLLRMQLEAANVVEGLPD